MKERRNKLGLTQEQVAECACISVRSYKMYEAHQRKPKALNRQHRSSLTVRSCAEQIQSRRHLRASLDENTTLAH